MLYIDIHFDVDKFYAAPDEIQRQLAVEAIQTGALAAARQEGWPIEAFEHAYDCVKARNYRNEWNWPRSPRRRPGKSDGAQIRCIHGPEKLEAHLRVVNRKRETIIEQLAFEEEPDEFLFVKYFGNLKWESQNHVVLYDKSGNVVSELVL